MSTFKDGDSEREIIIVRRGGMHDEEGHHGGVWKIAFADFMTAMMCFFLVMWLVNAANEQTKVAVASYFNPVKLVDRNVDRKGIDPSAQTTPEPKPEQTQTPSPAENSSEHQPAQRISDQNLFADPYAVLAEIAQEQATLQNVSSRGEGGAQNSGPATGANGGEMYRDPFAPDFWSQQVAEPDIAAPQDTAAMANSDLEGPRDETTTPVTEPAAGRPFETAALEAAEPAPEPAEDRFAELTPPAPEPEIATPSGAEVPGERTEQLAEQLRRELAEVFGADDALNRTVSVTARRTGVLISLTDELNYGMFEIGSAVPERELVLAMERIGAAIAARPGPVAIMGHTDGRPFRSADYDNWRLSSARAHSAYYMLVRGGLPETRVSEIAGFADRQLRVPEEPLADANRRIEIFLEVPQ